MKALLPLAALAAPLLLPLAAGAFDVRYEARILPDTGMARVSIAVEQGSAEVRQLSFVFDSARLFDETANGELRREGQIGRAHV